MCRAYSLAVHRSRLARDFLAVIREVAGLDQGNPETYYTIMWILTPSFAFLSSNLSMRYLDLLGRRN
jgi:hypothetical protein